MLTPQQREVIHLFDHSICPDPNVFVFIGFTVFTLLWMFWQSVVASQPRSCSMSRSVLANISLSTIYTAILAVLLLDGCWLGVLYTWGVPKLINETAGMLEWMATLFSLGVMCVFLVAGFIFWVVTIVRTVNQLILLWSGEIGLEKI